MKIISNVNDLTNIINNDGVVLMQVDTIFGLICNGTSDKAMQKVEQIKHRNKPSFGFFVKDIKVAKKYAKIDDKQEICFNAVFPGYFTLIFEATELSKKTIPNRALGKIDNLTTIGLRVPNNDFCLKLLQNFDFPLLATSANISGEKTATKFEEIDKTIIEKVDAIYYNENIKIAGLSSTIINLIDLKNIKIIRNGSGDINLLNDLIKL